MTPSPTHRDAGAPPRRGRWLLAAALLALGPKCALCVLAYAGLGAALGFGGGELCGPAEPGAATLILTSGFGLLGLGVIACQKGRRRLASGRR